MADNDISSKRIRSKTIATLVVIVVAICLALVAILTPSWLHFQLEDSSGNRTFLDVGLYQVCLQDQECVQQIQGSGDALSDLASHFQGQTGGNSVKGWNLELSINAGC